MTHYARFKPSGRVWRVTRFGQVLVVHSEVGEGGYTLAWYDHCWELFPRCRRCLHPLDPNDAKPQRLSVDGNVVCTKCFNEVLLQRQTEIYRTQHESAAS